MKPFATSAVLWALVPTLIGVGLSTKAQVVQAPGAPIAGLCVYSESLLLGRSKAGISANQQLAQIQSSVNAELSSARDKLVADNQALEARKSSLSAADYDKQAADLRARAQSLEALTRTRNDQLVHTRDAAISQISTRALPVLNASLTAHHCAIVVDRASAYSVNPAMDLTGEVLQQVDAALPSVSLSLAPPQS